MHNRKKGMVISMNNKTYINSALKYISKAWNDESLTLDKVASAAGFSNDYFNRMFAEHTGMTVMEYVRNYRLIRSAVLLRSTDRSIIDIALDLGYSNQENYTKAFKNVFDMSPGEYRKKNADVSLKWKETSTGAVIRQFEAAFPSLERVDPEAFLDSLMISDPLIFAENIIFLPTIDFAVYRLSDDNEYAAVEEYRPSEMIFTLFCESENVGKYLSMAKKFDTYNVSFILPVDSDFDTASCSLPDARITEYLNYAYLEKEVGLPDHSDYSVRKIEKSDEKQVTALQSKLSGRIPFVRIFEQKFDHGNFEETNLLGLFDKDRLIGLAAPTVESGRGLKISDIGGYEIAGEYRCEKAEQYLWASCIRFGLEQNAIPMNSGVNRASDENAVLKNEEMGYSLISHRYVIRNNF